MKKLRFYKRSIQSVFFCISLFLCGTAIYAQSDRMITGIVVDENGEPLPAAHVQQVALQEGQAVTAVVTDLNGHFRLMLTENTSQIEVSFLGFETKRVQLTDARSYRVELQPSIELLNEVVVTGYQTISRERATGAFAKIDAKKLETQRLSSVEALIEGRVAGYSDGKIRGVTTMNGVKSPLYVIDGFPVEKTTTEGYGWEESIPDLNMEDIESITILKDAAAASIYGARAANGVVVITTKRAKTNQLDMSFSATLTTQPYRYYTGHLADAATMIGLEREWASMHPGLQGAEAQKYAQNLIDNASYTTQGIRTILNYHAGAISGEEMNRALEELASRGYRYYDDVEKYGKRNLFSQQYNLSIGKKVERNTFNASVSYRQNLLEDIHSDNESVGVNLLNSTEITSWISIDLGTYLNYGSGTEQGYDLLVPGYKFMPYNTLIGADGTNYTNTAADRYSKSQQEILLTRGLYNLDITPLDEMGMKKTINRDFSNRSFARLNLTFTDWLKYTASFQYEVGEYKAEQLKEKNSFEVRNRVNSFATANSDGTVTFNLPYGNIFATSSNSSRAYNFRQQLDLHKTFGENHDVTAILGTETRENKILFNRRQLHDYDPDLLTFSLIDEKRLSSISGLWGWDSFVKNDVFATQELVNRYVSFYGNAAYTYAGKYMVTGSLRWDRTNLFATGSKYQNKPIWSTGAAWNINKEDFFDVDFVDMLKLRMSYGIGGNIAKNSAPYMTAYYGSNNHVGGVTGTISSRPNPELRWEKTTTTNIGVDFALLKNRLNGTIEYYNKKGVDLLANTNGIPTEGWGFSTYTMNNGEMTNQGVEFTLSGDVFATKDWNWNVSGVLGYNKNKVTYVNVKAPVLFLVFDQPAAYPRVGNPYNAIYGYEWAGLNEKGLPQIYDAEGNILSAAEPTKVEDAIYLGTSVPVWNGAVNTNLTYKAWELAAQFMFEGGHKMRNTNVPYLSEMGPVSKNIVNRWKQPGDEAHTDIPRYVSSESPDYNSFSSRLYSRASINVIDASSWNLRNVSLTYRVPNEFSGKYHLRNVRVMLGMENVFMMTKSAEAKWLLGGYTKPTYLCGVFLNF